MGRRVKRKATLHWRAPGTALLVGLCLAAAGQEGSPQLGTAPVVRWAVGFCVGPLDHRAAEQDNELWGVVGMVSGA